VHLPSDHPPVTSRHGRSCHDAAELDRAFFEGCTYALLSPVFPPSSKPEDRRSPLGIEEFLRWSAGRPVVALGGVDAGRAEALDRAGAWGIAAISAYFPCGQKANRSSS
jgi:thiamine monophosphate synthase